MSTDKDDAPFRADVAKALGAIGRSLEVMQANLFITRAVIDLLAENNLLSVLDIRHRALRLGHEASVSPDTVNALEQLLEDGGPTVPLILQ